MKEKSNYKIDLGDITKHNVGQLKRLNTVIFPVMYNDKFYKDVLDLGELAQLVYFNDIIVGAVCCRVEKGGPPQNPNNTHTPLPSPGFRDKNQKKIYIMTLGCLPKYRRLGVGTVMLEHVFKLCEKFPDVEAVYLHVQLGNDSALEFYKKEGFEITNTVEGYYKRIEPSSAYVLEKVINSPKESAAASK
ncbi:N-alpha-acetyltransferase 50-like [Symsagittifera roscoffensis]|uniref:N-alpha-acetyltransferase 50-like n=1 Tax=Symsagittifera roscoffensis TaxID=84072 RepID=UPI00307C16DB